MTSFELTGYQRSVIINEKDQLVLDSCISSCEEYGDSSGYIHPAVLSRRAPYCNGRLVNCISGGDLEVCRAVKKKKKIIDLFARLYIIL